MSKRNIVFTGDSPSLWNVALSPGWSKEEIEILRMAIMKFGVGKLANITKCGCLPGNIIIHRYLTKNNKKFQTYR